jgi:uncharacterized OB-fold protein
MRTDFPLPDVDWPPTARFWEAAAECRLELPRCGQCGRLCWYPKETCSYCGGSAFAWEPVAGRARLFSWAVVRNVFLPQYRDKVPYVTGLVSLEEDPSVRLVTEIVDTDVDAGGLEFDQPMEVVFRSLRFAGVKGTVMAPLFRPVRT